MGNYNVFILLSFLKTPTTVIIITTVHNSNTQLYCELAIHKDCPKNKNDSNQNSNIYNVHMPGAHNGAAVRKVGAGIAHAFN